jgi:hypothetical protein
MHARIETDSALAENTIAYSKYIKPAHLRTNNQKVAHIVFGFSDRNNTNKAIEYGMYVEGKEVKVRKRLAEPKRCLKCQHFGHFVPDCKAETDTCARCNGQHRTTLCIITDTEDFECANCTGDKAKGHGAADRNCPNFNKEKAKLQERMPENKYKFFPSSSPRTWSLLNQPETLMNEHQQAWQQGADWATNTNINSQQAQQFTDEWQEVRRRRGYQRPPPGAPGGRGPPIYRGNERPTDNGWPVRPAQSTLEQFMGPTQPRNTQRQHQQAQQNIPWADGDTNEQGPGPEPERERENTPLSYVG